MHRRVPGSARESRIDLALSASRSVRATCRQGRRSPPACRRGSAVAGLNPRIGKKAYHVCLGHDLAQQFEPLRHQPAVVKRHARDVAAGPVQASTIAGLDRIASPFANTIGIVDVAALAASAELAVPRDENRGNLAANQLAGHDLETDRTDRSRATSKATLRPSTKPISPRPLRNAARVFAFGIPPLLRNPITGFDGCCVRAARRPRRRTAEQRGEIASRFTFAPQAQETASYLFKREL